MRVVVLTTMANIFDLLRQLPVGLIAAAAFLLLTFFVILLWLEVAALNHALHRRAQGGPSDALQRMCDDLDRIEGKLAELNSRLETLDAENRRNKDEDG